MKMMTCRIITALFLGALVLSAGWVNTALATVPAPMAEYLLDGNTVDSSGLRNHALISGAMLTSDRKGKANAAYCFDGGKDNWIEIPLKQQITHTTGNFSTSFWIKTTDTSSQPRGILTDYRRPTTSMWGFHLVGNKVQFVIRNESNASSGIVYPVNDGKWHHILGIRDAVNRTMSLFVDGVLVQTISAVAGNVNSGQSIWIGDHLNRWFVGCVDEVRLWNVALSPENVAEIYTKDSGKPPVSVSVSGGAMTTGTNTWNFETGNLSGWTKTDAAFDKQPTYGDNPTARHRGQPSNHTGNYWIGGYENRPSPADAPGGIYGDQHIGTLTSSPFVIQSNTISFLIGGGCDINQIRAELIVNGSVVLKTTGRCDETMKRETWNVSGFKGQTAQIRLVDSSRSGWGHINFDDVTFQ